MICHLMVSEKGESNEIMLQFQTLGMVSDSKLNLVGTLGGHFLNFPITVDIDRKNNINKQIVGVYFILKIFCTLPVSSTTLEHIFSKLKRLKTYLRNTVAEDRLNKST
ncbi:52 kDa repressor of the inhibitor of the protein kinase-like, partial [Aphis craccivora]